MENKTEQKTATEIINMIKDEIPYGIFNYTENCLSKKDLDSLIEKIRGRYKLI